MAWENYSVPRRKKKFPTFRKSHHSQHPENEMSKPSLVPFRARFLFLPMTRSLVILKHLKFYNGPSVAWLFFLASEILVLQSSARRGQPDLQEADWATGSTYLWANISSFVASSEEEINSLIKNQTILFLDSIRWLQSQYQVKVPLLLTVRLITVVVVATVLGNPMSHEASQKC